jgi:hypothetical protein
MAYASDGTLWTAGSEVVGGEESGADYHVLRHFNAAGELIGSYLPRSTFRSRSEIEYGYMSSVDGRIGWYCGPIAGPGGRYYEVTNDGIQQFPGLPLTKGDYVDGIGVTEGGGVYASTESPSKHKWELFVLDKALGSWRTVLLPGVSGVSRWARLYGSDGTSLVFAPGKPSILTFFDIVD